MRFLQRLPAFDGGSAMRTWAIGIAINVCREHRRRDQRRPAHARWCTRETTAPDTIDAVVQAEDVAALVEVVSELPDRQREAIVLRYFEDLNVSDTAAAMNVAEGTVKATVHQALRAL